MAGSLESKLDGTGDHLATHRLGYCFLANPLEHGLRVLSKLAFLKEGGFFLKRIGKAGNMVVLANRRVSRT